MAIPYCLESLPLALLTSQRRSGQALDSFFLPAWAQGFGPDTKRQEKELMGSKIGF
jgi:hypothetical protein